MTFQIVDPAIATTGGSGTDGASVAADWRSGLPGDLQSDKALAQIKDVPSLARSYLDTKRLVGDSIRLPKVDAKPEERQKFLEDIWGKLGRPSKPEEYGIGEPEGLPDGMPWDGGMQEGFLTEAHKLGLTKDQAQGVVSWYATQAGEMFQATRKTNEEATSALRSTWGGMTERNTVIAHRAAQLFGPKLAQALNATGMGNDPDLIKAFYQVGKNLAEVGMIAGEVQGGPSDVEIQGRIDAILKDSKHPFHHAGHPQHQEARQEYERLWKARFPE